MKKNWIYLEPFVFIWQDSTHYLLYNSLNGRKVITPHNDIINPVIQSLSLEKNAYCTEIDDNIINKKELVNFINVLSSNLLGNIVINDDSERPVNLPPFLMLERSVENSKKNKSEYFDSLILKNISEITIQVSGKCNFNCKNCGEYDLQLVHCSKSEYFISDKKIENLVKQIKHLNLQKINIIGGDILNLTNFEFIVNIFSTAYVAKIYNIHYTHAKPEKIRYILDKDETSLVRISVHCEIINETELIKLIESVNDCNSRILWSFIVGSEFELEFCYSVLLKCDFVHNEIRPFYNKTNEEFIREFVFIDSEDIEELNPNKGQIFSNQVINRNYFGKITILANEQVSDNFNFGAVGSINNFMEDNIHKIIQEGRSWRWIRSSDICNNCLYKYICPPPSNLELAMKSKTICQTPKSYKSA